MSRILSFSLFETSRQTPGLSKSQIDYLNSRVDGEWKLNADTGLVDVLGSFSLKAKPAKTFNGVRFGRVTGDFDCSGTSRNQLTSLEGAPHRVDGFFSCSGNKLTSLVGGPQQVGGDFWCNFNPLTSLEGAPQKVDKNFSCDPFSIKDGAEHWNVQTWLDMLAGGRQDYFLIRNKDQARPLLISLLTLASPEDLAHSFRKRPLDLDLLDDYPELKQRVLHLTGLPDTSGVAQAFRSGLV